MSDIFDNPRHESDASARYAAREFIERIAQLEDDLAAAREEIARLKEDSARMDWLEKHGSEIDKPVEHEPGVKHTGLCWYPDPFKDEELFVSGKDLREATDAARAHQTKIDAARAGGTR